MKKIISAFIALPFLAVSAFSENKLIIEEIHKSYKACKHLENMGLVDSKSCDDNLNPKDYSLIKSLKGSDLNLIFFGVFADLCGASNQALEKSKEMIISTPRVCSEKKRKLLKNIEIMQKTQDFIININSGFKPIPKVKPENDILLKTLRQECH